MESLALFTILLAIADGMVQFVKGLLPDSWIAFMELKGIKPWRLLVGVVGGLLAWQLQYAPFDSLGLPMAYWIQYVIVAFGIAMGGSWFYDLFKEKEGVIT